MARNTVIFVVILVILAALLTGINIGRRLTNTPEPTPLASSIPAPSTTTIVITPSPSPSPVPVVYKMVDCGVQFEYDPDYSLTEASQGARLTHIQTGEKINVACTDEIPKPPLPKDKIETITVAGVKTKLYHDASAKDGEPVDVIILKHPKQKLEIGFFGIGAAFTKLLETVQFLP